MSCVRFEIPGRARFSYKPPFCIASAAWASVGAAGFGLGWAVLKDPTVAATPQTAGSWTWGGVYGNAWFVDPAEELSVVNITNTAIAGMTGAFPDAIRDAVYGAIRP